MRRRTNELLIARGRLLERIDAERREIARTIVPVERALATVDRAYGFTSRVIAYVRAHPSIPVLGIGALFVLRTRRTLRWLRRGFIAWRSFQALRTKLPFVWAR